MRRAVHARYFLPQEIPLSDPPVEALAAVAGEYTQGTCDHDGITSDCYPGTLEIARDSKD